MTLVKPDVAILGKVIIEPEQRTLLPFYEDPVSAGFPSPASDYQVDDIDLNDILIKHPAATYLALCQGQSMIGKRIDETDILVVDRSIIASTGDIVIAAVNGQFTMKEFNNTGERPVLVAHNPEFPNITLRDGDVLEMFGVVTSSIIRHRKI